MAKAVMEMMSSYVPKSFLEAKKEAERDEKLYARVVDLDDRINQRMN